MESFTGAASIRLNRNFEQIKKQEEADRRADEFFEKVKNKFSAETPEDSEIKRRVSKMGAIVAGSILLLVLTRLLVVTDAQKAEESVSAVDAS